jgi:hypothetical protein
MGDVVEEVAVGRQPRLNKSRPQQDGKHSEAHAGRIFRNMRSKIYNLIMNR